VQMQALRGAVQLQEDTPAAVKDAAYRLMDQLVRENRLDASEVVSVFFSQTSDLKSYNPATASREGGFTDFTYFCLQELEIDGAMPRMIRVLLHICTRDTRSLKPVYLDGAEKLRPDLF